jgi:hypothetical protein
VPSPAGPTADSQNYDFRTDRIANMSGQEV